MVAVVVAVMTQKAGQPLGEGVTHRLRDRWNVVSCCYHRCLCALVVPGLGELAYPATELLRHLFAYLVELEEGECLGLVADIQEKGCVG